ncbi:GCN5 family acetyltransferase [Lampropedia cohaerens]|uniref:GCN5 family acetyltransferase n=1 Tax=Lampropedia cohaerens TaxID=1610491 RepID=A0A0U1Q3F4_9BURK|nr:GNAT family N-acetyltransferase [Lampropedia cohaerens]KKW69282.1 GCN5 family acetyltransferase [Lampropedia cohaerens]
MDTSVAIELRFAHSAADYAQVRELLQEYVQTLDVALDLQSFEQELAQLPGEYAEPHGCLVLAHVDGAPAGCCAMRPLVAADYSNAAEMRRLYVRKPFRGFGLGRQLAQCVMEAAQIAGYSCILLDTLGTMDAARALYEDLGFEEIDAYYFNPHPDAFYFKADL